jgi:hypothetical protein
LIKIVIGVSVLLIVFGLYSSASTANASQVNGSNVVQSNSSAYGTPYSEWLGKWWSWWLSIPNDEHPGVDYNAEKCAANQMGSVWMLPDVVAKGDAPYTKVDFSCKVPEGKAILFPISTGSCWLNTPEFDHVKDKVSARPDIDAELKKCAVEPQDKTEIFYVNVDGVDVKDQLARVTTSFYNVTPPNEPVTDLFSDIKNGTSRAIADGYFLFLEPLSAGEHLLEFSVEDDISGNKYAREGSYKVLVE